jgi:hypothetical protein
MATDAGHPRELPRTGPSTAHSVPHGRCALGKHADHPSRTQPPVPRSQCPLPPGSAFPGAQPHPGTQPPLCGTRDSLLGRGLSISWGTGSPPLGRSLPSAGHGIPTSGRSRTPPAQSRPRAQPPLCGAGDPLPGAQPLLGHGVPFPGRSLPSAGQGIPFPGRSLC